MHWNPIDDMCHGDPQGAATALSSSSSRCSRRIQAIGDLRRAAMVVQLSFEMIWVVFKTHHLPAVPPVLWLVLGFNRGYKWIIQLIHDGWLMIFRGLYYPIYWGLWGSKNGESLFTNQYDGMTEGFCGHCLSMIPKQMEYQWLPVVNNGFHSG